MTKVNPFISSTDTVELFGLSWLCPDKDRRWRLWWLGDIILTHPGGSLARPGQVTSQCWVHVRAAVPRLEDLVNRQVILLLLQCQQQQLQVFEVKGQEFDREGLFRQCIYVLYASSSAPMLQLWPNAQEKWRTDSIITTLSLSPGTVPSALFGVRGDRDGDQWIQQ